MTVLHGIVCPGQSGKATAFYIKCYDVLFVDKDPYSNVANLAETYICLCGAGLRQVGWLMFVCTDGSGQKDW